MVAFKEVCDKADMASDAKAAELGALMDASHASCSQLYECRCVVRCRSVGPWVSATVHAAAKAVDLSALMDASHASCSQLCEDSGAFSRWARRSSATWGWQRRSKLKSNCQAQPGPNVVSKVYPFSWARSCVSAGV